jgi:hypothetical protein
MEFCLCTATGKRQASGTGGTHLLANGVGQIPTVLWGSERDIQGCVEHAMGGDECRKLPEKVACNMGFRYFMGVYVDNFIQLAIARSIQQLCHVANAVMFGIHDVFLVNNNNENDPISLKKLKQLEGQWALEKEILGFDFDGEDKSMILATQKRDFILDTLRLWAVGQTGKQRQNWNPFRRI